MAKNIRAHFDHDGLYHVFNRTNNKETLFRSNANRMYFLNLCRNRLNGYLDIYAMALLRNHFHLAIRIKSKTEILSHLESLQTQDMSTTERDFLYDDLEQGDVHVLVARQFSRVFNSYTQAFNKRYSREGHLFHAPFKRSSIRSESSLISTIHYIHLNSKTHGVFPDFKLDKWHSYDTILKDKRDCIFHNLVNAQATVALFESRAEFIRSHHQSVAEASPQGL